VNKGTCERLDGGVTKRGLKVLQEGKFDMSEREWTRRCLRHEGVRGRKAAAVAPKQAIANPFSTVPWIRHDGVRHEGHCRWPPCDREAYEPPCGLEAYGCSVLANAK